jgi:RNase P/RNase MRP subunit p30
MERNGEGRGDPDLCAGIISRSTGMTHRFVVPSALVELLLAEHTTATLFSLRLGLDDENSRRNTIRKLAHILRLIYVDLQHNMINDI